MEEMKGVRRMEMLDPLRSTGLILHPTNSSCQERYQDFFDFSFLYFIFSSIFIFHFNLNYFSVGPTRTFYGLLWEPI